MGDIKLPDYPAPPIKEESYISAPVTSGTMIKLADLCNWLNFYAKRVSPYVRYSNDTNKKSDTFPFPVGGAYG